MIPQRNATQRIINKAYLCFIQVKFFNRKISNFILMVSCGGSSEGDDHKICEEDLDLYFCWSSGAASSHYICKKGEEAKPFYNVFSDNPDDSNEILGYCSDNEYIECHSGCDENTGRCFPE